MTQQRRELKKKLRSEKSGWAKHLACFLKESEMNQSQTFAQELWWKDHKWSRVRAADTDTKQSNVQDDNENNFPGSIRQHVTQTLLLGQEYVKMAKTDGPFIGKFVEMYEERQMTFLRESIRHSSLLEPSTANNTLLYTLSSVNSQKDIEYYKLITQTIESHLNNKNNVFCRMVTTFRKYFHQTFEPFLSKQNEAETHFETMVDELRAFISFLFDCVNKFYNLPRLAGSEKISSIGESPLTRDNMITFLTSFIMDEAMYKLTFEYFIRKYREEEQSTAIAIEKHSKNGLEFFGVTGAFALDKVEKTSPVRLSKFFFEASEVTPYTPTAAQRRESFTAISQSLKPNESNGLPYTEAFETLMKIDSMKSPLHKVKLILKTAESINTSLRKFLEKEYPTKTLDLDAEHLFSILIYVLVQSGVKTIKAHTKFIEAFSTTHIRDGISGYYCTSFEAACEYLKVLL